MTHIALLSVILLSSLLSWTSAETSILCTWTKVLPNGDVHYNFLRGDPRQASPSPRLYHSAWSGERALLSCSWSDDAAVIHNYLSACLERAHEFSHHPDETLDVESMLVTEELCVSVGGHTPAENHQDQAERSEFRTHQFKVIVPGTLWCGSGNKAKSYADLGRFASTDSCCREHDHCNSSIPSFHSKFGVFNNNSFTMSHCDCDNKFHDCLIEANDPVSDLVGGTYFNVLKTYCFDLSYRLQCTDRSRFGMCNETKMSLYAEVLPPRLYISPNPAEDSVNGTVPIEMLGTSNATAAAASTLPPPSTSSHSATITNVTTSPSEGLAWSTSEGR